MSEADLAVKPAEAPVDDMVVDQPEATEANEVEKPQEAKQDETKAQDGLNILKTTASIDYKNPKNNRKFDPSVREVTSDPDVIRKQVEFYFGDWNFPQDKFMWESCGGSENKPIAVEKIHSFKRMRVFQPYSAVVAALRESTFLEVSGEEGKEEIKRKVAYKPLPASKAKAEAATVYVKGFGDETPETQFELESFFAQFGEVRAVKLRRTNENLFKGSVFVTFSDDEIAKKFLALDPAPKWKEHDLKIMSKHDYCEEKSELIRQGKLQPNGAPQKKFFEGKDFKGSRGRGDKDKADANDWKKRRENDQKNGFQDRRDGGRGRGRGGRGGGRGGRGRGGRGGRDFGRDRQQEARKDAAHSEDQPSTKRPREEDGSSGSPSAKRVDNKAEAE